MHLRYCSNDETVSGIIVLTDQNGTPCAYGGYKRYVDRARSRELFKQNVREARTRNASVIFQRLSRQKVTIPARNAGHISIPALRFSIE